MSLIWKSSQVSSILSQRPNPILGTGYMNNRQPNGNTVHASYAWGRPLRHVYAASSAKVPQLALFTYLLTDNQTEAYRMCSGSQQGRTGVGGDGGRGSLN